MTNRGINKRPYFSTPEESTWYEKTPKRVIFAIMKDFAHIEVGIEQGENNPQIILDKIKEHEVIVKHNKLDRR